LSGATSSVSSVVDHEEVLTLQWFFADDWNAILTETLQTDYVTGDVGSNSQLDVSWDFAKNWELTGTLTSQRITAQPIVPGVTTTVTPAQTVNGGGLAIAYDW
jgi:hypothetical protein